MRRLLMLMLGLFVLCAQVLAQRTVTGRVTDDKGAPLPNVSITIKGSNQGTVTGTDGSYSLNLPANAKTIVISAVGMQPKEIAIGNQGSINVSLDVAESSLQEVVVVGYGTKTTREVTGSISKVSGGKVAEVPLPSFDQALAGKTAGVQINATGGTLADGVAIRIRGINSISSSSQPLIVVDGVPQISLTNLNGFNGGDGTRFNPLALLNPNDIESIEVLKDAGSSVIYGSRAANGVLLITTKRGKRGTAKINFEAKTGWSNPSNLPDLLSGDEFAAIQNEKAANRFGATSPNAVIAKDSDVDGDGKPDRTNWLDEVYRTAMTKDYSVSMSGGSEKGNYFASGRYLDQEGISYGNRLKQGQGRLNLEISPKTWFKSGMDLSYSRTLNNGILTDRYLAGSVTSGWQALPNVAVYNPNGVKGYNLTTTSPIGVLGWGNNVRSVSGTLLFPFNFYNPIAAIDLGRQNNTAEELRGSVFGELQVVRGLKLTTKFGVQNLRNIEDQYTSPFMAGLGQPYNGLLQNQDQNWRLWDWQNFLTFDRTFFTDHKVALTAGSEFQRDEYFYTYTGAANFSDPFFQYIIDGAYTNVQPGTTTTLNLTGGDRYTSGLESYFGRLSYNFKSKYFIEGSVRRDAFSGFGENNKWGTFPSVSAGWEATKEDFLAGVNWLNYLKVRGSFGKVGNSRGIGPYASRTLYSGASYTATTGLGISQAGNAGLAWESSEKLDIGFDANVLNNKLGIVFDYFKNDINNMILAAPTLYTVGIPGSSISTNIGGMQNKGYEITLNATPVSSKDFRWTSSLNYTNIKNEVTGLVPSNNNADITSGVNVASVGKPLGTFFLPRWAGVDAQTGNPMWFAKDGTIKRYNFGATGTQLWTNEKGQPVSALGAADYIYLEGKQGLPKWYGGWDNTFGYKNIELSVSIMYQGGNYLYNSTRANMLTNSFSNNFAEIKERWQKPGDVTEIPRLYLLDNQANVASDRFLEKGDFLRVRTVTLGYNLPKSLLSKISFDGIRVYGQVFNALTLTKYSGADPEVNTNRFNNIAVGTDLRNVPQARTVTFGIQASF